MKFIALGVGLLALLFAHPFTAQANEALAAQSGCLECHHVTDGGDKKLVGPSFQAIAARYRGNTGARAALIDVVKKGGKNNWSEVSGGVPMPPYSPRLSDAEIQRLIDWMLRL